MSAPNTAAVLAAIAALAQTALPWVTAGAITTDTAPAPYAGPKPWGLLRAPRLSIAHRESGELGNRANTPNVYALHYLETPYTQGQSGTRTMEEARVYSAYDAIAGAFITPDGTDCFIAGVEMTWDVSLETSPDGPYLDMRALGQWIGGLIVIRLEERY